MSALLPLGKTSLGYSAQPNKTFITTKAFNSELFNYSTSFDYASYTTTGSLIVNPGASSSNCPAGRVLHANGKFLKVGVHPNITKFYMGVYDPVSFLSGYIDPSLSTFASYDVNMPYFDDAGTGVTNPALGGNEGKALFAPDAGMLIASPTGGHLTGAAVTGRIVASGATSIIVNSSAVTSTSRIFLGNNQNSGATTNPFVSNQTNGQFIVSCETTDEFVFLVVN